MWCFYIYDVDIDMLWRLTMSKQWRENKIAREENNITYTIDDRVCNTVRDDSVTIYRHAVGNRSVYTMFHKKLENTKQAAVSRWKIFCDSASAWAPGSASVLQGHSRVSRSGSSATTCTPSQTKSWWRHRAVRK